MQKTAVVEKKKETTRRLTSANSLEAARKIKESSARMMKKNYRLLKRLENR